MRITNRNGSQMGLWFEDIDDFDLSSGDFDPIATYQASAKATSDESDMWSFVKNGFGVKNATDTDGFMKCITWSQFEDYRLHHKDVLPASWDLSGITARTIHLAANEWCVTPIVKVFEYDATSVTTFTTMNWGKIL